MLTTSHICLGKSQHSIHYLHNIPHYSSVKYLELAFTFRYLEYIIFHCQLSNILLWSNSVNI